MKWLLATSVSDSLVQKDDKCSIQALTFPPTDENECSLEIPPELPGSWAQSSEVLQSKVLEGVG